MKRIFTFLMGAFFCTIVSAQAPTGVIKKTTVAPVIDGEIDAIWATANEYNIMVPFNLKGAAQETPTLGAEGTTTWKALWDADGIYVLVKINDDVWSPVYEGTEPSQGWMYDKPEIYFDVNSDKKDGKGAGSDGNGNGNGHYQFAPAPVINMISGGSVSDVGGNGAIYAFKVTNPAYVVEYFVPFSKLLDRDLVEVIRTEPIGFDISITDADLKEPNRNRATWSNGGALDENWNVMDDAGTVTLEGAVDALQIDKLTLTGGTITTDNGTLQIEAAILPAEASNKNLRWSVVNETGKATINSATGLLTALTNGTVTVIAAATDGSFVESTVEVTISGQVIQYGELSLINDGFFNTEGTISSAWGSSTPKATVVEGKLVCSPPAALANPWDWNFQQSTSKALPNVAYILSFVAYADAERAISVDFEDNDVNAYNRYGITPDPESANGRSQWDFNLTTTPKKYTFHVTFDQLTETSVQKVQFMLGQSDVTTYMDSIVLITEADFALPVKSINSAAKFKVYPNPVGNGSFLNVEVAAVNSKVTICNSIGQKVIEKVATSNIAKIDVSSLKKGMYFVRLEDGSTQKFIK